MKIIHLSDPHIYTDKIHGIDPVSRFKKALDHILKNHNDADLFVITGDITDLGDKESYQLFIKIIQDANLPEQLDPKLIIGNHDNREEFKKNFPLINLDENGLAISDTITGQASFLSNRHFIEPNRVEAEVQGPPPPPA